jgi:hypothetical protein
MGPYLPGAGIDFDGLYTQPIVTEGADADVTLWNAPACRTSLAWVMITDGYYYAQSGYGHLNGCSWDWGCYFVQWFRQGESSPYPPYIGWQIQSPLPYPATYPRGH